MSYIALRRMRIWILFLVTINFVSTIAWYSCVGYLLEGTEKYNKQSLQWGDWMLILSAFLLFFAYTYSLGSYPRPGIKHKLLRTFLILIPTGVVFGLRISFIVLESQGEKSPDQSALGCPATATYACIVVFAQFWVSLIAAFFILLEMGLTFAWGPLERPPVVEEEDEEAAIGKEDFSPDTSDSDLSTDATATETAAALPPPTTTTPRTAARERANLIRSYF
ncbi:MAG: hypothetical protein J3R72DRAFT_429172, partial [Linnemannia gamsii]